MDHNRDYYFTYFVVFKSSGPNLNGPILLYSDTRDLGSDRSETMHLFDDDLDGTLDAVEYLIHLPRNMFDVHNMDELLMASSYDTPHFITILPDTELSRLQFPSAPTMFVLADDCDLETKAACELQKPLLGTFYSCQLNQDLLKTLWMELWQTCKTDASSIVPDIGVQHILRGERLKALPALFFSRQFQQTDGFLMRIYNSTDVEKDCIKAQWNYTARLQALASMRAQGVAVWSEAAGRLYEQELKKAAARSGVSVVITFPGVARRQKKHGLSAGALSEKEKRILRIIGVHRAIARGGVLIELPCAEDALFRQYGELENRCMTNTNNKYVWRALNNLGKQLGRYFSHDQLGVLRAAKDITVFSDFPIGLAVLEGDEMPLQCCKSISYRPLTPLTRRFQYELLRCNQKYLGRSCKIAMAECVPDDEQNKHIYPLSREVYHTLLRQQKDYPGLSVVHKEIDSVASMKIFIEENPDADILYISAHGSYDRARNMAGIIIGDEVWMASEDLFVPPIVILSACHASPRGIGSVTIADMFLRNGALAVLGSFVPIDVKRNLILMTRLFAYIAEAQNKHDQYRTLADAWSGIVATNTLHELMAASSSFQDWMCDKNSQGTVRAVDFQLRRCVGRLRRTHMYSDTVQIVKEMLAEEGMQGRFGDILDQKDYFPESFFYQLLGSPENIFLYNEIFDEYSRQIE